MKSLCCNLGKEFQPLSHFCPPFCLSLLNFVRVVNQKKIHRFALNFTVLHSISLFCTGEIALIIDLGLIAMFSANQTTEIVACILLR